MENSIDISFQSWSIICLDQIKENKHANLLIFHFSNIKCKPWQNISRPMIRAVESNYIQINLADLSFMKTLIFALGMKVHA